MRSRSRCNLSRPKNIAGIRSTSRGILEHHTDADMSSRSHPLTKTEERSPETASQAPLLAARGRRPADRGDRLVRLGASARFNAAANRDDANPADAIAVFGAAEYAGRPSPVLHARLDKAVSLYRPQIAPDRHHARRRLRQRLRQDRRRRRPRLPAGQRRSLQQHRRRNILHRHRAAGAAPRSHRATDASQPHRRRQRRDAPVPHRCCCAAAPV